MCDCIAFFFFFFYLRPLRPYARRTLAKKQQQQGVPGRQLMEDRWPGGEETPFIPSSGGSQTLAWPNRDHPSGMDGDVTQLRERPSPDPFAMERPPMLNGGGEGVAAERGGGAIGVGEIRAKLPARYAFAAHKSIDVMSLPARIQVEWAHCCCCCCF